MRFNDDSFIKNALQGISDIVYPRLCESCKRTLHKEEHILCLHCNLKLPRTLFHDQPENLAAQIFVGRVAIQNTSAFLYFTKDGITQHLLHLFKYNKKLNIGYMLGTLFAAELQECDWISDIDMIIPVPLHKKKEKSRGFNQAEILAGGLGKHLSIEVKTNHLIRSKFTVSQTKKSRLQRLENVAGVFSVQHASMLKDKHILLVDDVLTTGATLESCALELLKIPGVTVSLATIAIAKD